MSRKLDDLDEGFKPQAIELLARLAEAEIPCFIVDTLRTKAEQEAYLASGASQTIRSKHLKGMAIDVCPYEMFQIHGPDKLLWDADNPANLAIWTRIGEIGEGLGLRWGGRWKSLRDYGHFELPSLYPK